MKNGTIFLTFRTPPQKEVILTTSMSMQMPILLSCLTKSMKLSLSTLSILCSTVRSIRWQYQLLLIPLLEQSSRVCKVTTTLSCLLCPTLCLCVCLLFSISLLLGKLSIIALLFLICFDSLTPTRLQSIPPRVHSVFQILLALTLLAYQILYLLRMTTALLYLLEHGLILLLIVLFLSSRYLLHLQRKCYTT